jgi:tRNA isopentenyl-2-thiomethyl-A-37 hydroxylase MiaE
MLAGALAARGDELASLYEDLWREEAGHHTLFIELAERSLVLHAGLDEVAARATVATRLDALAQHEADIVARLPLRPAIH